MYLDGRSMTIRWYPDFMSRRDKCVAPLSATIRSSSVGMMYRARWVARLVRRPSIVMRTSPFDFGTGHMADNHGGGPCAGSMMSWSSMLWSSFVTALRRGMATVRIGWRTGGTDVSMWRGTEYSVKHPMRTVNKLGNLSFSASTACWSGRSFAVL